MAAVGYAGDVLPWIRTRARAPAWQRRAWAGWRALLVTWGGLQLTHTTKWALRAHAGGLGYATVELARLLADPLCSRTAARYAELLKRTQRDLCYDRHMGQVAAGLAGRPGHRGCAVARSRRADEGRTERFGRRDCLLPWYHAAVPSL